MKYIFCQRNGDDTEQFATAEVLENGQVVWDPPAQQEPLLQFLHTLRVVDEKGKKHPLDLSSPQDWRKVPTILCDDTFWVEQDFG